MLDHIDIAVADLKTSGEFYTEVLAPLGIVPLIDIKRPDGREGTGYGRGTTAQFWIGGGPMTVGRLHFAFSAESRKAVDEFHSAALRYCAVSKGEPGQRSNYGENYYAAFVLDPNGHTIEAVCRVAE